MSESKDNSNLNSDEIIKRLVRLAREDTKDDFIRPSDETIEVYLCDKANEIQQQEMEITLIASSDFRKEIRDIVLDSEKIAEKNFSEPKEDKLEIVVPKLSSFIASKERKQSEGIWDKIINLSQTRATQVVVLAAAALIILTVVQRETLFNESDQYEEWSFVETVETPLLISSTTRDITSIEEIKRYDTPREAALAAFRDILEFDFDTGEFSFRQSAPILDGNYISVVSFTFVNENGEKLVSVVDSILERKINFEDNNTAFLLTIPDKNLYKYDIEQNETFTIWPRKECEESCLVFIYHDTSGYYYSLAKFLKIK